jgi:hypothetical protein
MSTLNGPCLHTMSSARHTPVLKKTYGWMYADVISCDDCDAKVILCTFDDPRDDSYRNRPLTWGENYRGGGSSPKANGE